jgi:hypothetical protein
LEKEFADDDDGAMDEDYFVQKSRSIKTNAANIADQELVSSKVMCDLTTMGSC